MKKLMNWSKQLWISVLCFLLLSCVFPLSSSSDFQNGGSETLDQYEYLTYDEMTSILKDFEQEYSEVMSLTSLGTTFQGRDIWMVKLSDNVDIREDEPGVLLMGAHHGIEKPSYEILVFFIRHMVENFDKPNFDDDQDGMVNEDPIDGVDNDGDGLVDEDFSEQRIRDVLNSTQIFILPMMNPDGVEAGTRKNCAPNYGPWGLSDEITSYGVDLNRNYGFRWFLYYIFPRSYHLAWHLLDSGFNYRGEHPFSENETSAVKELVDSEDISISLSFHTYGQILFYPYMHTSRLTPHEDLFVSVGENISGINGYELYGGMESIIPMFGGTLGTSENWLYGEHNIISFTVELCSTRAPTNPAIVFDVCWTHVGVNLYVCERAQTIDIESTSLLGVNTVLNQFSFF